MTMNEKYNQDMERDGKIHWAALQARNFIDLTLERTDPRSPMPRSVRYYHFNQNRKYVIEACQKLIDVLQNDLTETV